MENQIKTVFDELRENGILDARRIYAITETAEYKFDNIYPHETRYAATSMANQNNSVIRSEFIKVET